MGPQVPVLACQDDPGSLWPLPQSHKNLGGGGVATACWPVLSSVLFPVGNGILVGLVCVRNYFKG